MIGKTRQSQKCPVEEVYDVETDRPRGILRWPPPEGQFRHVRQSPPPDLAPWIESYWMVEWRLKRARLQETLPHPNFYLVFENRKSVVGAINTSKFSRVLEGWSGVFGVKFKPGGIRPFLPAPAASFLNQIIPAARIFGKDVIALDETLIAESWKEDRMIEATNAFFRARLPRPHPAVELTDRIVRRIRQEGEIKTVADLAKRTGIEKRKLQRIFHDYVGVSPKWVIRRFRLHELVEVLNSGKQPDWCQLALDLGYFDQAHLINDFKAIVGAPPAQYRRSYVRGW
jgi:AraC-like DNA-binding protein